MDDEEKWQLGIQLHPGEEKLRDQPAAPAEPDPANQRLQRPLYVLTVERFAYFVIAAYLIVTRTLALGARPLAPAEATGALAGLAVARDGLAALPAAGAGSTLMHLVEAALFWTFGAGDLAARLGFAGCGMILLALAMRPYVGRAGALALAALFALSPTLTWFSRAGVPAIAALVFTLLAVRLFLAFIRRPGRARAAACGLAAAAGLSIGATGAITAAIFMIEGLVLALWEWLPGDDFVERWRYWWGLHLGVVAAGAAVALAAWLAFATGLFEHSPFAGLGEAMGAALNPSAGSYAAGLRFYAPILGIYEFLPVLAAAAGFAVLLARRMRSRFARWCWLWTLLAAAFYLWSPARAPGLVLQMLLPMTLLAAMALDYLYRTRAWNLVRYPLAVLVAVTVYLQITANFVCYAPDAGQAPWARQALLLWTEPATTAQVPREIARVAGARGPAGRATLFFEQGASAPDVAVLRWYLRDLAPAGSRAQADVIVLANPAAEPPAGYQQVRFELLDRWSPSLAEASAGEIAHYLLDARAWSTVETREVAIAYRAQAVTAPTVTLTPESAAPESAAGPTASPAPAPQPTPTAQPPSPSPTAAAPSAVPKPAPVSASSATRPAPVVAR